MVVVFQSPHIQRQLKEPGGPSVGKAKWKAVPPGWFCWLLFARLSALYVCTRVCFCLFVACTHCQVGSCSRPPHYRHIQTSACTELPPADPCCFTCFKRCGAISQHSEPKKSTRVQDLICPQLWLKLSDFSPAPIYPFKICVCYVLWSTFHMHFLWFGFSYCTWLLWVLLCR